MENKSFGNRKNSISSKVSKFRILNNTPVPSNLKFPQKLETTAVWQKTKTLSFIKIIMEEERELIPDLQV